MPTMGRAESWLRACVLAGGGLLFVSAAAVAAGSLNYPIHSVGLFGGAAIAGSNITLPGAGNSGFLTNVVLPLDYRKNGKIRIVLYMSAFGAPCTMRLGPSSLLRARIGASPLVSLTGLSAEDGSPTIDFPGMGGGAAIVGKIFVLEPNAAFGSQRGGDVISITFQREASHATDDCGPQGFVRGIQFRYPLAAAP
jgi:hypothetical protein